MDVATRHPDSGEVPLFLFRRPFVPIYLNAKGPVWFVFDTGAVGASLDAEVAESLGLECEGNLVTVATTRLGTLEWANLPMSPSISCRRSRRSSAWPC